MAVVVMEGKPQGSHPFWKTRRAGPSKTSCATDQMGMSVTAQDWSRPDGCFFGGGDHQPFLESIPSCEAQTSHGGSRSEQPSQEMKERKKEKTRIPLLGQQWTPPMCARVRCFLLRVCFAFVGSQGKPKAFLGSKSLFRPAIRKTARTSNGFVATESRRLAR